jgi:hypothetical protein
MSRVGERRQSCWGFKIGGPDREKIEKERKDEQISNK